MQPGELIRKYRTKRKLPQSVLARMCGISIMTLRRYETGEREISAVLFRKIADILRIPKWEREGETAPDNIRDIYEELLLMNPEEQRMVLEFSKFLNRKKQKRP